MKSLQREEAVQLLTAACFARPDDIYPASLQPGPAAGKTPPASIHSIQTPQPAPRPQPGSAAYAPLPLRSYLQCTTNPSDRKGCVPQTDTIELDTAYVENWSFRLDLKILLRTAGVVLQGTGV